MRRLPSGVVAAMVTAMLCVPLFEAPSPGPPSLGASSFGRPLFATSPLAVSRFVRSLLGATEVCAHSRSRSFSLWTLTPDKVTATFSVPSYEVSALLAVYGGSEEALSPLFARHLRGAVRAVRDGKPCGEPSANVLPSRRGFELVELEFSCPGDDAIGVTTDAFFDLLTTHVHHARVDGSPDSYVFSAAQRSHFLGRGEKGEQASSLVGQWGAYVKLGLEHIGGGLDHLAFLMALLLTCKRLTALAWSITGFTFGHSLSLSAAALGRVSVDGAAVEAMIGFTVALVAAAHLARNRVVQRRLAVGLALALGLAAATGVAFDSGGGSSLSGVATVGPPALSLLGLAVFSASYVLLEPHASGRVRFLVTVFFGLIHGFGFAGALAELELPAASLVQALVGFNVGVELGQLAIVAGLWAASVFVARAFEGATIGTPSGVGAKVAAKGMVRAIQGFPDVVSAALVAVGTFWFLVRGWGA